MVLAVLARVAPAAGEVVVRGATVFSGYLHRADSARTDFLAGGWFCTGDLAVPPRNDEGAYFRIVDRCKDMVLVGGENVYTAEVEGALYAHPAVMQAAVFGVPNDVMGEMVAAAVVLKPGGDISPSSLQSFCRTSLAAYKVPYSIRVLDRMPTTGSGKIRKEELKKKMQAATHHRRLTPVLVRQQQSTLGAVVGGGISIGSRDDERSSHLDDGFRYHVDSAVTVLGSPTLCVTIGKDGEDSSQRANHRVQENRSQAPSSSLVHTLIVDLNEQDAYTSDIMSDIVGALCKLVHTCGVQNVVIANAPVARL